MKKGAMFGLDARIALAIFGALSVISGAALYSAIQEAKITAYYTTAEELFKSNEAYLLDVGSYVPLMNAYQMKIKALAENIDSVSNWNGPYTSLGYGAAEHVLSPSLGLNVEMHMHMYPDQAWDADVSQKSTTCDKTSGDYYFWVRYKVSDANKFSSLQSIFSALDSKYDESNGKSDGEIRYREISASDQRLYIRGNILNI